MDDTNDPIQKCEEYVFMMLEGMQGNNEWLAERFAEAGKLDPRDLDIWLLATAQNLRGMTDAGSQLKKFILDNYMGKSQADKPVQVELYVCPKTRDFIHLPLDQEQRATVLIDSDWWPDPQDNSIWYSPRAKEQHENA